jgi:hypothetical protein
MKRLALILVLILAEIAGADFWKTDPNLVAWYKMDDNADSNIVADTQGFSDGNSVRNTSSMATTGKVGGALTFNGTSDYIDTGEGFQSTFGADFSITGWFNLNNGQPSKDNVIINLGNPTFNIVELTVGGTGTDGQLIFAYIANGDGDFTKTGIADFAAGATGWNMFVCQVKQVEPNIIIELYLNGSLLASKDATASMASFSSGTKKLIIGTVEQSVPNPDQFCDGSLDNVMIFNKALTQSEVTELYLGNTPVYPWASRK